MAWPACAADDLAAALAGPEAAKGDAGGASQKPQLEFRKSMSAKCLPPVAAEAAEPEPAPAPGGLRRSASWAPLPTSRAQQLDAGSLWALARCNSSGRLYAGGRQALVQSDDGLGGGGGGGGAGAGPSLLGPRVLHRGSHGTYALALSSCGSLLHAGCGDGVVRSYAVGDEEGESPAAVLVERAPPRPLDQFELRPSVFALVRSSSQGLLFAGDGEGDVHVWRSETPPPPAVAPAEPQQPLLPRFSWQDVHGGAVTALALLEPPTAVASSSSTPQPVLHIFSGGEDGCLVCTALPHGATAAEYSAALPLWRAERAHSGGVTALAVHEARRLLFSASWDGLIGCRHVLSGEAVPEWTPVAQPPIWEGGGNMACTSLALCPGGARLYCGWADGSLSALSVPSGAEEFRRTPAELGSVGALSALQLCERGEALYASCVGRRLVGTTVSLPAKWEAHWGGAAAAAGLRSFFDHSHSRFPEPFRAALRQLALGASDAGCLLGACLGPLDAATRSGLLLRIAGHLAREAYGVEAPGL